MAKVNPKVAEILRQRLGPERLRSSFVILGKDVKEPRTGQQLKKGMAVQIVNGKVKRVPTVSRFKFDESGKIVGEWIKTESGSWKVVDVEEAVVNGKLVRTLRDVEEVLVPPSRYAESVADESSTEITEDGRLPRKKVRANLPGYAGTGRDMGPEDTIARKGGLKGKQPGDARGKGPETRRAFAQDTTPPETFLNEEDVIPEEMPRFPKSDGKDLAPLNQVVPVSKVEQNRQIRAGIQKRFDDQADAFLMEQAERQKIADYRERLEWSDGDYKTLQTLGKELDVKVEKYKTPSELTRAIKKKINSMMNVYGGVPKLTAEQMRDLRRQYDYDALEGRTQAEINRLNQVWHETHPKEPSTFNPIHRDPPTVAMTAQRRAEMEEGMRIRKFYMEQDEFVLPRRSQARISKIKDERKASGIAFDEVQPELTNEYLDETDRIAERAQRFKERRSTSEVNTELKEFEAAERVSKPAYEQKTPAKAKKPAKPLRPASVRMAPSTGKVTGKAAQEVASQATESTAEKIGKLLRKLF